MTISREQAILILTEQKGKYLEIWAEPDKISNAYDLAIEALIADAHAVKPIIEKALYDFESWHYVCGSCNGQIDKADNYCRHCGKPIEHD